MYISLKDRVLSASFFDEPLVVPQVFWRRQDFSRCGGGVGVLLRRVALLCRQELVPVARRATWQSLALGIVKGRHLSKAIMIPQKEVTAKHQVCIEEKYVPPVGGKPKQPWVPTWIFSRLRHKVPGIFGVDTRAITKRLRMEGHSVDGMAVVSWPLFWSENSCGSSGSALGAVVMGSDSPPAWEDPNLRNLVAEVSVCFCSVGSHWNEGAVIFRHTFHEHVWLAVMWQVAILNFQFPWFCKHFEV